MVHTISGVISGSLPLYKRGTFNAMLSSDKSNVQKILVESAREVSRDADVAKQIYKAVKARGIEIIPHGPTPMTELEKNLIASRSDLMFLGPLPCLAPCCRGRFGKGGDFDFLKSRDRSGGTKFRSSWKVR